MATLLIFSLKRVHLCLFIEHNVRTTVLEHAALSADTSSLNQYTFIKIGAHALEFFVRVQTQAIPVVVYEMENRDRAKKRVL